jgi:hypothetical protein
MLKTPVLSEEQVDRFHGDGFVVFPGAFDAAAMAQVEHWVRDLAAMPEEPGRHWVYHEDSRLAPGRSLINRIEKISPFHAGFAELSAVLRAPVAQLLGEEAVLFKEKINFKMPGGGGFEPHQDSQAGWERYARYFVSVMVSIDEATLENGCLKMVAGHHQQGLFREWEPLTEADTAGMDFVPCPTKPGDIAFFDCYAPHASDPNDSDAIRRIYFATYNRLSEGDHLERYYADKHESFPPDIERVTGRAYVYRV